MYFRKILVNALLFDGWFRDVHWKYNSENGCREIISKFWGCGFYEFLLKYSVRADEVGRSSTCNDIGAYKSTIDFVGNILESWMD